MLPTNLTVLSVLLLCSGFVWTLPAHNIPLKRLLAGLSSSIPEKLDQSELVEPPSISFSVTPKDTTVTEGDSLVLTCEATGVPPPTIQWRLNDQPIDQGGQFARDDNSVEKLLNVGLLTIQSGVTESKMTVNCADARNAGRYSCVADNNHEAITADAAVMVLPGNGGQKCGAVASGNAVLSKKAISAATANEEGDSPAEIFMWTNGRFEREGASVQLYCRAKGSPTPKVFWVDPEGNEINTRQIGSPYVQLPSGDLLIGTASFDLLGTYKCVAVNPYGQDEVEVFFYATEPEPESSDSEQMSEE